MILMVKWILRIQKGEIKGKCPKTINSGLVFLGVTMSLSRRDATVTRNLLYAVLSEDL